MKVSNPDKLIFEKAGLTKADLVGHYELVAGRMLTFCADRPLTLQRFPSGIEGNGFMQKNAGDHFPPSIRRFEVPKQDGGVTRYPVVDRAEDLAYLANQGTVTFHMWTSTTFHPDHPDWMVIDLDPSAGDIEDVRRATRATGEILGELGVRAFPLVTGSSGFHVWAPIDRSHTGEQVMTASRALAGVLAARHPDAMTTEFLKKNRAGRVFIDWLRNGPTATVVVPWSLRPRPSAPVAVPIRWDEVDETFPDGWTLGHLADRLALEVDTTPQRLPIDDILALAEEAGIDLETPFDRFGR